jgi:hypothetical protein
MQTGLLASVAAEVVKEIKITDGRSNLYLRQNITPVHSQKKKENSLECELEKITQEIEKLSNQHSNEIYGKAFDAASKTMVWKSALIRLHKTFTNIKKGRGSDTDHFQTTEVLKINEVRAIPERVHENVCSQCDHEAILIISDSPLIST